MGTRLMIIKLGKAISAVMVVCERKTQGGGFTGESKCTQPHLHCILKNIRLTRAKLGWSQSTTNTDVWEWTNWNQISVAWSGMDWMKQCRLNWIRIDRKLMERNTVKCNWKGRTRHEVDWDRSICTTLLYDVTPYTLGCIYTVHFLWCSYDECAVNNRSIGST